MRSHIGTMFTSGGLELLQRVSESVIRQCVSENVGPQGGEL